MPLQPTAFTNLVGCTLPLQQAGMGAVSTPALAVAVARAGALAMVGATGRSANDLVEELSGVLSTAGDEARVGANFLVPFMDVAAIEATAQVATVVEFFFGDPLASTVARVHDGGALAAWQVGSLVEARAAVDAGCDFIVVQGREAGGHVRGSSPLLPFLRAVRAVETVPVVAAGGIGSGAAIARALREGADAVRIGTRLVATEEADVHPSYAQALVEAGAEDTVLTEAFSLGWAHAPHRVLQSCIAASDADPSTRSPLPPTRDFAGDISAAALYAGESVRDVRSIRLAADVLRELVRDAEAALQP